MVAVDMGGGERRSLTILSSLKKGCRNPRTRDGATKTRPSLNVTLNTNQRYWIVMHGGKVHHSVLEVRFSG